MELMMYGRAEIRSVRRASWSNDAASRVALTMKLLSATTCTIISLLYIDIL